MLGPSTFRGRWVLGRLAHHLRSFVPCLAEQVERIQMKRDVVPDCLRHGDRRDVQLVQSRAESAYVQIALAIPNQDANQLADRVLAGIDVLP
jgi:hypothetical protein